MTVQQISRKAKQIRKKGEKWISAIRRASKMLKGKSSGGTIGARRKPKFKYYIIHDGMAISECSSLSEARRQRKQFQLRRKGRVSIQKDKIGAVKFIERNETRSTPARKVYRINRSKSGTFKGVTKVAGIGKASLGTLISEIRGRHKSAVDKLVVRKYRATKKRDKKKIQKSINEHNAALRKL